MNRRNSLRLGGYDYAAPGTYFVTICTAKMQHFFGRIEKGEMQLSPVGKIAEQSWLRITSRHTHIEPDVHQVMPNHVHLLFRINDALIPQPIQESRQRRQFAAPLAGTVSGLIGSYKSSVTQRARQSKINPELPLWHRGFHDRIVRSEEELRNIRAYIQNNPARWQQDKIYSRLIDEP